MLRAFEQALTYVKPTRNDEIISKLTLLIFKLFLASKIVNSDNLLFHDSQKLVTQL